MNELYYKDGYTALALIVNATMILFCLFCVKLYAIYFVKLEAWNVKKGTSEISHEVHVNTKHAKVPLDNVHTDRSGTEKSRVPDEKSLNLIQRQGNAL